MTISLKGAFYATTLWGFLCWSVPLGAVGRNEDVIISLVPIRAIYGTGKWYIRNRNGELPVRFDFEIWEVYVYGRKPIVVETCLGRRKL